jgi:hypothetical protein
MLTCKSPRKVMRYAYELARQCLPSYSCKFSRHDYTLPQLFACLVVREHQKQTFRGVEALLRDARHWCKQVGMKRVPDHNTLWRAFHALLREARTQRLMGRLTRWMLLIVVLGRTCAIDSTLYQTHHCSRHYEHRCRSYASHGKVNPIANARRSRSVRRLPKLILSVDTRSHVILAACAQTGQGSDARHWEPLLRQSKTRVPDLREALGDAGFDSHENHQLAREQLKIRSWIKARVGAGRPSSSWGTSDKGPTSRYRRLMQKKLKGSQKGKPYGKRSQVETVNSMMKRNLGDHLRARTPEGRRKEQMLRAITHNLSLLCGEGED